ncbi:predicted protein [Sclerotinia sclerotiorum 1980 UF-70]|uniref:Peptidase C51 domain-containing protein n=1 Tax=Sclerotinia sclerotiorum (strain ATCC 18683 / 1980 / Ss-1) TaxID=665079 RepID=A7EX72_SCLS1|nr:predicted protein [Sclerotinia sclerotiorum 1980 UF-70]EDN94064.1 predicted protein [Sclerotinia sclerotiorum 1980 UF-70]
MSPFAFFVITFSTPYLNSRSYGHGHLAFVPD